MFYWFFIIYRYVYIRFYILCFFFFYNVSFDISPFGDRWRRRWRPEPAGNTSAGTYLYRRSRLAFRCRVVFPFIIFDLAQYSIRIKLLHDTIAGHRRYIFMLLYAIVFIVLYLFNNNYRYKNLRAGGNFTKSTCVRDGRPITNKGGDYVKYDFVYEIKVNSMRNKNRPGGARKRVAI